MKEGREGRKDRMSGTGFFARSPKVREDGKARDGVQAFQLTSKEWREGGKGGCCRAMSKRQ